MNDASLRINRTRMMARLDELAAIGAIDDGGCCRLALTDEDRAGRDLVSDWMRSLGMQVRVDAIGNIVGQRAGRYDLPPVMTGSHIDTVRTGGRYDGNLGVLAGLEVIERLNESGVQTDHPLAVAVFTNEEGARFAPDMLGSLVYVGGMALPTALNIQAIDGARLGDELQRIAYAGDQVPGTNLPSAFVELHIEQGPILDAEEVTIGVVKDLQGISWQEISITGQSNHAGTTPMRLRRDAGYCASAIVCFLREMANEMGGAQVCTTGRIELHPNLINVIAARATVTADLRNTDETLLQQAESRLTDFLKILASREGVTITTRQLARFEPVIFDAALAETIHSTAVALNLSCRPMTSGAGHDAQMLARCCPSAMIFVPSHRGISHNPAEHTDASDLEAGANVLLQTLLTLAHQTN